MRYIYGIKGTHCASCIEKIKSHLSQKFKITSITLNPPRVEIEAAQEPSMDQVNNDLLKIGEYQLHLLTETNNKNDEQSNIKKYYPLFLIFSYISVVAFINNFHENQIHWLGWMNQFMAGFFLVFSGFKLLDIKGFAEGYSTYDLLAARHYHYGYVYPFLELMLGILYLTAGMSVITQILTILIMGFSSLGVINSLIKRQHLRCACLGTIINVPLSTVTLIEDLTMVGMAIISLILILTF